MDRYDGGVTTVGSIQQYMLNRQQATAPGVDVKRDGLLVPHEVEQLPMRFVETYKSLLELRTEIEKYPELIETMVMLERSIENFYGCADVLTSEVANIQCQYEQPEQINASFII